MMAWSASLFNGGGALLSVACMVMMALLVWLLIRLTATDPRPAPRVGVEGPPGPAAIADVRTGTGVQAAVGDRGKSASVGP